MPITLSSLAAASYKVLTFTMRDWRGETITRSIKLAGDITDADVVAILTRVEGLSNAVIDKAWLSTIQTASGMSTVPAATAEPLVAIQGKFGFSVVDPLNASKTINRSFYLPAYVASLNSNGVVQYTPAPNGGVTPQELLGELIQLLENNLAFELHDGTHAAGMNFDAGATGFFTAASVTDGR